MIKKILTVAIMLSMVLTLGCSTVSNLGSTSSSTSHTILRKAELASQWQMYQMNIDIAPSDGLPILLKLSAGDKVDGYFYLEKGDNVNFDITSNSLIYKPDTKASGGVISDRFAFVASQEQGSTYTLTFGNNASKSSKDANVTVFLEIIYPVSGSIFIPLEAE